MLANMIAAGVNFHQYIRIDISADLNCLIMQNFCHKFGKTFCSSLLVEICPSVNQPLTPCKQTTSTISWLYSQLIHSQLVKTTLSVFFSLLIAPLYLGKSAKKIYNIYSRIKKCKESSTPWRIASFVFSDLNN